MRFVGQGLVASNDVMADAPVEWRYLPRTRNGPAAVMRIVASPALATLVPALLTALLAVACAADDEPARGGFYAEVAVEVEPRPGDPLARLESGGGRSVIRWWYAPDPARWRWEFETTGTGIDDGVLLTVADGDESWEYDDRTNVYRRGVFAGFPDGVVVSPVVSAPLGPAHAATVDALMAQWRDRGVAPEIALGGEATLLGRPTQVVELRAPDGVARVLIDPARMFIMRWAVDATDGGQSYHAEVTALDYGTEIDAARFTFEPPPGAREADPQATGSCTGSSYLSGAAFPAEPGFLAPTYMPAGYRPVGVGHKSGASSCDPVAVWVLLEAPDDGQILLGSASGPAASPRWMAPGRPRVPALTTPTPGAPGTASSACCGALGRSSRCSRRTPPRSMSSFASRSPPASSRHARVDSLRRRYGAVHALRSRRMRSRCVSSVPVPGVGVGGRAGVSERAARDDARESRASP